MCNVTNVFTFTIQKLLTSPNGHHVSGDVGFVHQFINMTEATGTFFNSTSNEWEYVIFLAKWQIYLTKCVSHHRFMDVSQQWVIVLPLEQLMDLVYLILHKEQQATIHCGILQEIS